MKGIIVLQVRVRVSEIFSPPDAKGHFAPSGKRHSLSRLLIFVTFDTIDHVPSNIPESSCQPDFTFSRTTKQSLV